MMDSNTKLTAHPDVLFTRLKNGQAALLHLNTKSYFSLNTTGARIWMGMSEGKSLEEISQDMTEEFDVDLSLAQTSVLTLADQLVGSELMHVAGA